MDAERLAAHQLRNSLQSLLLAGSMGGLCVYLAWLIAGVPGTWLAVAFVGLTYLANPVASPRLVMAIYRAAPILPQQAPRLYAVLRTLAERAGLSRVPNLCGCWRACSVPGRASPTPPCCAPTRPRRSGSADSWTCGTVPRAAGCCRWAGWSWIPSPNTWDGRDSRAGTA
jgi:hypothetical protein